MSQPNNSELAPGWHAQQASQDFARNVNTLQNPITTQPGTYIGFQGNSATFTSLIQMGRI